ncbi:hypothetical protein [Aquisalimonas asiatica]|uniref:Outer membrane protein beta-barrel domain-containing protein n=1 Tax=Aquisalimonas asiatica TaxID=406100 RepID=A0A1H8TZ43_9GAMM|nr:hypothetical protein [Aquisalimonas asiatica]SEO95793.1 hypothetical protein SAMN04488052_10516 [Aquisalimonas asiatica]
MTRYGKLLLPGLALLLGFPAVAAADGRAVALEVDRRMYAGIAGFTAQSRMRAEDGAGSGTNSLSDGLLLRLGRTGRPARYDVELARTNYDEGELWLTMASLDYLIPGGDLFSGYVGIVGGYGRIEWNSNDPFGGGDNFGVRGERDSSYVAGLRGGGLIEVTDLVQVEIGYRYLHTEFSRQFDGNDGGGKVQVRNLRMVHAGVNFRF